MKTSTRKKRWMIAGVLLLLIVAVTWHAYRTRPDVTIVFVGGEDSEWAAADAAFDAVIDAWHRLPGHEEDRVECIKTGLSLNTETEREAILAQIIYGEGVIYLADRTVIESLLDIEQLFSPLPPEIEATTFRSDGRGLGVCLKNFSALAHLELPESFCYFVRSAISQDKTSLASIEKNQPLAFDTLFQLMN